MRTAFISRVVIILTLLILAFAEVTAARAQQEEENRAKVTGTGESRVPLRANPSPIKRKPQPPRVIVKTVTKEKLVTPITGTLSVAAEPKAVIFVEPVAKGRTYKDLNGKPGRGMTVYKGTVPMGERQFIFNDLKPGRYRVYAELDGYYPVEKDNVVVVANKALSVTLPLKPKTYTVTINTNVSTGQVTYEKKDEPERIGGVVRIQNGHAELKELLAGEYDVDIIPGREEAGYQTLRASIKLPDVGSKFNVKLNRLNSTATFSEAWINLDGWDAPNSWRVASGKLLVNGEGVAIPRNEKFLHYTDFQLSSDVNMISGVAASFVVRAADKQNYYLIQLTGPNVDEPYVLRGFIVKKGVLQSLQAPIRTEPFIATIKPGEFIHVLLTMKDNKVDVKIRDNQTGELVALGILTDPDRNFTSGAVGIAARDNNERNEIWRFTVCAVECPKE